MSKANFPVNPVLTAIAIAYRNRRMIADDALPRTGVGKQEFKYLQHDLGEGFALPKTIVSRTSRPNQVEFKRHRINRLYRRSRVRRTGASR